MTAQICFSLSSAYQSAVASRCYIISMLVSKFIFSRQGICVHKSKHNFEIVRVDVLQRDGWHCGFCHWAEELCSEDCWADSEHNTVSREWLAGHNEQYIRPDVAIQQVNKMAPMKKKHGRPTTGGQRLDRLPQIRGHMYQHLSVTNLKFHLSDELSSKV